MPAAHAAAKTLTIGISDSLSGPGAVFGVPQSRAFELAVQEINDGGGFKVGPDTVKLKTIVYDDKGNPTEATNTVRTLIDRDGVKFITGFCCSGPTSAVASFIGNEDVAMFVGTAAERSITAQGLPNLYRDRPPGDYTGAAAGTFVAAQGIKKLAVIGSLDSSIYKQYLDALRPAFEQAGGKIIAEETFGLSDRDMTSQLTKIRALNPDAIFVLGLVEQVAFVHRQANELGMKLPRFGFSGGSEAQFLKVATSEQMEGAWDLRPLELTVAALGPTAKAFVANYTKKLGEAPTPNAPYAYDLVYVLEHAFEKAGTIDDVHKVLAAVGSLQIPSEVVMKYVPIDGRMFDKSGQAYIVNGAFQWQKGKWVLVKELPTDVAAYSQKLTSLRK